MLRSARLHMAVEIFASAQLIALSSDTGIYLGEDEMLSRQQASDPESLTLTHGAGHCDLLPLLGGSIAAWTVEGQPMLRAASAVRIAARDPFGMASFPLVPYSNRIGNATFEWDGRDFALARNFPPEMHAIHGVGFQRPWRCTARSSDSALLTLIHQPDAGWPWPFEARQRVTIAERELTLDLTAVNLAPRPVPLAFGHHPYFPRAGAFLTFHARGVWLAGEDGLPSERVKPVGQFDFSRATGVEQREIDHCFTGWTGPAHISWANMPWSLEISGSPTLPSAVVCIREGDDGFCFEPVPHINNSLNMSGREPAIPVVGPGKTFCASVRFRAVAA
jgi:aldose 1-epimerase